MSNATTTDDAIDRAKVEAILADVESLGVFSYVVRAIRWGLDQHQELAQAESRWNSEYDARLRALNERDEARAALRNVLGWFIPSGDDHMYAIHPTRDYTAVADVLPELRRCGFRGDTMSALIGRRYPDNTAPAKSNVSDGMEPGGYALHDWTDPPHWQIRDPFGKCASINLSLHSVEVHDDETITVNPSIWDQSEGGFHGWLKHGVWSW